MPPGTTYAFYVLRVAVRSCYPAFRTMGSSDCEARCQNQHSMVGCDQLTDILGPLFFACRVSPPHRSE